MIQSLLLAFVTALFGQQPSFAEGSSSAVTDPILVHGMTISCQTWGWEWGTDGFARELDELLGLGVNWVAIHPYASIHPDGTAGAVGRRVAARAIDPDHPPEWIARPIREAHARGLSILVIPHIACWGSPWSWRGEIDFPVQASRERFFSTYRSWITDVARASRDADGFCVGNELEKLAPFDAAWRSIIAAVRGATRARLTYAANWNGTRAVPFWDALDAIGVQGYFPLCEKPDPCEADLRAGWRAVLGDLEALSRRTGKPVVLTELGYNTSSEAARAPWESRETRGDGRTAAEALQQRCLAVALSELDREKEWLRGAFLWKWFVGQDAHENFRLQTPALRGVIARAWGREK